METNIVILKSLCKGIKLSGVGDYWYDNAKETKRYRVFQAFMFALFYSMMLLEFLEVFYNTLPRDLHGDALTLSFAHLTVVARFHSLQYKKKEMKDLNLEVIEYPDEAERDLNIEKKKYRRIKQLIFVLFAVVFSGVLFYGIEGLRRYFCDNQPLILIATYWPSYGDSSLLGFVGKMMFYLILSWLMMSMIFVDMFAVSHLIILYFRFILLRRYFCRMEEDFRKTTVTSTQLRTKFLNGLFRHRELIRLSKKINSCFSVIMSMHILQGSCILVLLLLRTLSSRITLTAVIMNFFFGSALLIQLAFFLWNAGEITYQASLIPTAIFHCGWHLRSHKEVGGRDMRRLVLMGCVMAQRPVVMKALWVQELSYQAFVSVVNSTYSLFAVLYGLFR